MEPDLALVPGNWELKLETGVENWELDFGTRNLYKDLVRGLGLRTWGRELVLELELEFENWDCKLEQGIGNWNWEIQAGN